VAASSSGSTWLYLMRHGEVEHAREGRFFGHTDVALSDAGLAQAEALGRELGGEPIAAVYTSDLRRARLSARPLAAARGLEAPAVSALREMAMGAWEGLTWSEIRARDPARAARWLADPVGVAFPGGEALRDLRARVLPALGELLARHAGSRLAVVAHGGSNRIVLAEALGLPLGNVLRLAQDYACWNLIEYRGETAIVHAVNRRVPGTDGAAPVERGASGSDGTA
jgi:alpha-ribazole phosphatase